MKVIAFDLDDTLYPERSYVLSRLAADLLVPSTVQVYRSHEPDIQPYDDTVSALDEMRVAYRLALVTEGFGEVQAMKLESIGLQDYFEFVHIGDENEREKWKPSQYPFERMLDQMSVSGNQAAYVGDNPAKDFRGANELELLTFRVRRSDGLHALAEPSDRASAADYEFPDLRQFTIAIRD